jgi:stage V sporulation protein R
MSATQTADATSKLLFRGSDWDFETIQRCYEAIERIAEDELRLEVFPNRIELITNEQMLDAITSFGMPLMYRHWSFGKSFVQQEALYRHGLGGLIYEIVINSNPCISYLQAENSATMQALVIAHAAFGHNHFFRNNRIFQQWAEPSGILDYLEYAQSYIGKCEEQHGQAAVERVLDAAHALRDQGVHRHAPRRPLDLGAEQRRLRERRQHEEREYNDLWRTLPTRREARGADPTAERRNSLGLPEENLLCFIEQFAPKLAPWQREIIRIVRLIAQYFHPQPQVKMMNEGCATWVHQQIMTRLHETGRIDDAAFLEVLHTTSNVITQPDFDRPGGGGFNPYALGYAMMRDIARVCTDPTEEDRAWFKDFAGNGDPIGTLHYAWSNFRDESFVLQYLSPAVMRNFRMFRLLDDAAAPHLLVDAIHDDAGYREIRRTLASSYDPAETACNIQVTDVDLEGDRRLMLTHHTRAGRLLSPGDALATLRHVASLWGYEVLLEEVDLFAGGRLAVHTVKPPA